MHNLLEDHLESICPRCRTAHNKEWEDEWNKNKHYRSMNCGRCGYRLHIASEEFTSSIFH